MRRMGNLPFQKSCFAHIALLGFQRAGRNAADAVFVKIHLLSLSARKSVNLSEITSQASSLPDWRDRCLLYHSFPVLQAGTDVFFQTPPPRRKDAAPRRRDFQTCYLCFAPCPISEHP